MSQNSSKIDLKIDKTSSVENLRNATKICIKRGERKRRLPPASLPVGEEEREAGEVAGREREIVHEEEEERG